MKEDTPAQRDGLGVPKGVAADRACSSHAFRRHVWKLGARPVIPTRRNEEAAPYPPWRGGARYEKTARSIRGILC